MIVFFDKDRLKKTFIYYKLDVTTTQQYNNNSIF